MRTSGQVVDAGDDLLLPLYKALEQHAIAKGHELPGRTTPARWGRGAPEANRGRARGGQAPRRVDQGRQDRGINATGFYWETPDGPVILFYTGRHHAGEMVDQLLRRRLLSSPKLVKCTDGASKNFDHEHKDKLVEATCNAHALLKFRDIRDKHPRRVRRGREHLPHQVFDNDDKAKALGLSPVDRMPYHREHSWPLMKKLKAMCEEKG